MFNRFSTPKITQKVMFSLLLLRHRLLRRPPVVQRLPDLQPLLRGLPRRRGRLARPQERYGGQLQAAQEAKEGGERKGKSIHVKMH